MNKTTLVFLVVAVAMVALSVPAGASGGKKYELRYASEYPDKHPTVRNAILPWIDEVK